MFEFEKVKELTTENLRKSSLIDEWIDQKTFIFYDEDRRKNKKLNSKISTIEDIASSEYPFGKSEECDPGYRICCEHCKTISSVDFYLKNDATSYKSYKFRTRDKDNDDWSFNCIDTVNPDRPVAKRKTKCIMKNRVIERVFAIRCCNCGHLYRPKQIAIMYGRHASKNICESIFPNDKNHTVALSIIEQTVSVYNNTLFSDLYNYRASFNYLTGQTYMLQTYKNKKPQKKLVKHKLVSQAPIKNVSYGRGFDSFPVSSKTIAELIEVLCQKKTEVGMYWTKPKDTKDLSFRYAIDFNRMPTMELDKWATFRSISENEFTDAKLNKKKILRGIKPNTYINDMIRLFKLQNCKTFRKIIADKPSQALNLLYYQECGFQIDNINTMYKQDKLYSYYNDFDNTKFMNDYIKHCGESAVLKQVLSDMGELMRDTASMYNKIIASEEPPEIYWTASIGELHDDMYKIYVTIKDPKIVFNSPKRIIELADTVGDYDFIIPEDSYVLRDVSNYMHICVYSYSKNVANNKTNIVLMKKGNKFITCIEIQNNNIVQAKIFGNTEPKGIVYKTIKEWAKKHVVDTNCYDMNESNATVDYIEPTEEQIEGYNPFAVGENNRFARDDFNNVMGF